jgi:NTE family protein
LFPPMKVGDDFFGDGAMRQQHPLSPAVHLGADRLLVIGVRARGDAGVTVNRRTTVLPSPGEVFGYMLDTLFTDQIYGDLEQLERMNDLVRCAPQTTHGERTIETLMMAPSVDPREIAARHLAQMPGGLRALLRVIGGRDQSGVQLASYLMFEAGYTQALIDLGYRDAMQARTALVAFMSGEKLPQLMTSPGVAQAT